MGTVKIHTLWDLTPYNLLEWTIFYRDMMPPLSRYMNKPHAEGAKNCLTPKKASNNIILARTLIPEQ